MQDRNAPAASPDSPSSSFVLLRRAAALAFLLGAIVFTGVRASRMPGRFDACSFYYGSKLVLQGRSPYLDANLQAIWEENGSLPQFDFIIKGAYFMYPPAAALLVAPPTALRPERGIPGMSLYNYGFGLLCLFYLYRLARGWPIEYFALFGGCFLMSRPFLAVLYNGQATLVYCALLAGMLDALARGKKISAGLFLGLALNKFTLALPFFLLLLYRREKRVLLAALGVFIGLNFIFALPMGLTTILPEYRDGIVKTAVAGGAQDPMMPTHFDMVHLERMVDVVCGPTHRPLAQVVTKVLLLVCIIAACWVLGAKKWKAYPALTHPLEIALVMMCGLFLMYHRFYDLAAIVFVAFGLLDYHQRVGGAVPRLWQVCVLIFLPLCFTNSATGWSPILDPQLRQLGLPATPYLNVWLMALLFVCLLRLSYTAQLDSASMDERERHNLLKREAAG